MKSIFVLTRTSREVTGHGESSIFVTLLTKDPDIPEAYPAFETKEAAQHFIDSYREYTSWRPEITEIKIHPNQ